MPSKKPLISGFLLCLLCSLTGYAQRIRDCGFSEVYRNRVLQLKTGENSSAFENSVQAVIQKNRLKGGRPTARIIRIPVVVHVIHNTLDSNRIGGTDNANISVAQIESQIRILNEDYRRKEGTKGFNTNPVGADMEIEFYLATTDPNGQPSSGIVRRYRNKAVYNINSDLDAISAVSYWPSNRYLNIWVLPDIQNYLGYGQFPAASSVEGLDTAFEEYAHTDGIFVASQYFGDTGNIADEAYGFGRTTTHEIGHWLGLIHTWGDDYCGTDYCADTPPTASANQTRFCTEIYSTCVAGQRTRNMIENFLDYSPDACMNVFTNDQKARVRAVFEVSPRRRQLLEATNALPDTPELTLKIYPNPTVDKRIAFDATFTGLQTIEMMLTDLKGHILYQSRQVNRPGNRFFIDVKSIPSGLYILHFSTDTEKKSQRVYVF